MDITGTKALSLSHIVVAYFHRCNAQAFPWPTFICRLLGNILDLPNIYPRLLPSQINDNCPNFYPRLDRKTKKSTPRTPSTRGNPRTLKICWKNRSHTVWPPLGMMEVILSAGKKIHLLQKEPSVSGLSNLNMVKLFKSYRRKKKEQT